MSNTLGSIIHCLFLGKDKAFSCVLFSRKKLEALGEVTLMPVDRTMEE